MKVKLISYSKPVLEGLDTPTDLVAYCARVSNPSNQTNSETAERLIKYLVKHQHWSPLEMATMCLEIKTTRDIARQILRHRSFSFQEFSQRYADPTQDLQFETRQARLQDPKNRQNSIVDGVDITLQYEWDARQQDLIRMAEHTYRWAIRNGIAKEQARAVLPEGLTISRMYMSGTLRSWIHYI
jgi:thymidylate synthase (FAD)